MSDKDRLVGSPLTKEEKASYFTVKIVVGAVNLLSAIILSFIVGLAPSPSWTLNQIATSDYRLGGAVDDYPSGPLLEAIGNTKVHWIAVFIGYLFAAGTLVQILFHDREMAQISAGANPFLWISLMFWTTPAVLVAALTAGITNVWLLVFIVLGLWSAIGFWWDHDLINHPKYLIAVGKLSGGYGFIPWARGLAALVVVAVAHIVYLFKTFSTATSSPRTIFIFPALIFIVLILAYPVVTFLKWLTWFDKRNDTYTRDYFFLIYGGVAALVLSWVSLLIINSGV